MEEKKERLTWTFHIHHTEKSDDAVEAFQLFAEKWKSHFTIEDVRATFSGSIDEFVKFINETTDLSVMLRMIKK